MPTMDDMRQGGTPFDPFLYAAVGEDRNGNTVTVLSAMARLGLEPWDAAAELAGLTRAEARSRLDGLLARFRDVPTLGRDHAAITQRLVALLPASAGRRVVPSAAQAAPAVAMRIAPAIAMLLVVLYLINTLFMGSNGTGN